MTNILFSDLAVSSETKHAIADMGFVEATPIQSLAIYPLMEGNDIIGQAPTGTGKTLAFGVPLVEMVDPNFTAIQALVLCPTRELVIQTAEKLTKLAKYKKNVRVTPIYGGQNMDKQFAQLRRKPLILVATPGRLMDHLRRRSIKLDNLKHIVLDEADEMLNMGFREDIDTILESVTGEDVQTVLFSATLSKDIMNIATTYQKDAETISVKNETVTVPSVDQYYIDVKRTKKIDVLVKLLEINEYKLSIIFCRTKRMVDDLVEELAEAGYSAEALHGDIRQAQRDKVMARFRSGRADILVATDVAARGIDISNVDAVFNYDLPGDGEYYVHRIGRTGRANTTGIAYTFIYGREMRGLKDIMRYTKSDIKPMFLSDIDIKAEETAKKESVDIFEEITNIISTENLAKHEAILNKFVEDNPDKILTDMQVAAALLWKFEKQNSKKRGGSNIVYTKNSGSYVAKDGEMNRAMETAADPNKVDRSEKIAARDGYNKDGYKGGYNKGGNRGGYGDKRGYGKDDGRKSAGKYGEKKFTNKKSDRPLDKDFNPDGEKKSYGKKSSDGNRDSKKGGYGKKSYGSGNGGNKGFGKKSFSNKPRKTNTTNK